MWKLNQYVKLFNVEQVCVFLFMTTLNAQLFDDIFFCVTFYLI